MESGCSCSIGDFEPITCHDITNPKAIKEHKCDECGGLIKKGEKYYVHKGLCDGDWFRIKNCDACESIRHDYGCGAIGGLDDIVFECLGVHINEVPEDDQ